MCTQWRLRSASASDAQADLSLCWAHMPFCWFLSWGGSKHSLYKHPRGFNLWELNQKQIFLALFKFSSIYTCDTCFIFREFPEMSIKFLLKHTTFYQNFEVSLIWTKNVLKYSIHFHKPPWNERKISLMLPWNLSHVCALGWPYML